MIPLLDLTRQSRALEVSLQAAFRKVLRRGRFILGPEVEGFERELARLCRISRAVGVASGTDALELALRAAGVKAGDWVATVSFTFLATADAILQVGATPLFVDIDPRTYTMDPEDLERRLRGLKPSGRGRVKAVIPVHLFGHPCDMDAVRAVARRHGMTVIEDAAQALGARWKGEPVGSLGDLGCFSFFPTKNLGGFGDGGAVVTRSGVLEKRLRSLRVHGREEELQVRLGRNSRLDELQAALLRVKLKHLRRWVARRRALAALYTRLLSSLVDLECPDSAPGAAHAFHLYVIRSRRRAAIQAALRGEGIASQVYYATPVHRQPLHQARCRGVKLPQTERAAREVLALPLYPEMREAELKRVVRAIQEALR